VKWIESGISVSKPAKTPRPPSSFNARSVSLTDYSSDHRYMLKSDWVVSSPIVHKSLEIGIWLVLPRQKKRFSILATWNICYLWCHHLRGFRLLIQHNNVIVVYSFVVAYWVLVLGLCMKYIFRYWYTCTWSSCTGTWTIGTVPVLVL